MISSSGSSVRDTRMVSPRPSISSAPIPMADFMRPSSPSPACATNAAQFSKDNKLLKISIQTPGLSIQRIYCPCMESCSVSL